MCHCAPVWSSVYMTPVFFSFQFAPRSHIVRIGNVFSDLSAYAALFMHGTVYQMM